MEFPVVSQALTADPRKSPVPMTPPKMRACSVYARPVPVHLVLTDGDHTNCIPKQNQCQCPSRTEYDLILCFRESCGGRSVLIRSHLCWNWRMRSRCCCRRCRAAAGPGTSMRTCLGCPSGSGSLGLGLDRSRRSVAVMFTLTFILRVEGGGGCGGEAGGRRWMMLAVGRRTEVGVDSQESGS